MKPLGKLSFGNTSQGFGAAGLRGNVPGCGIPKPGIFFYFGVAGLGGALSEMVGRVFF